MEQIVFNQLEFVRRLTIDAVEGISEKALDFIPEGFNNNVRWNLGHIYLVQERFAFHYAGEPVQLPDNYGRLFAKGTKPADWNEGPPKLDILLEILAEQPKRIQVTLSNRFGEQVKEPLTTGSGLTLSTIGEFLNYTLYHEGMHFNAIRALIRFTDKSL
ncbi:DinB family protein [Paenibacillus sp. WQ 127069]|uniref:DinB family protein n=1 Tax=Paenibacillus baimaensis TaxID=2982185 RepID=A0ABT2ULK9_9BACL|nr:DinB family protein [Paenibacillus sp. WQ 127069]MCU6795527.1 DinB family protein [Paenibacillus sp. WQ 127069]